MKSTTRLRTRVKRKTSENLVAVLLAMRKYKAWHPFAHRVSGPQRKYLQVNLSELNARAREGDTLVVAGKILGVGSFTRRARISALGFSASAAHKLKEAKVEIVPLIEEIKKNPHAEGVSFVL